jgi:hypothetical protein
MTRNLFRYSLGASLASLALTFATGMARGQNTPEMREVLSRLEHLEQTNQALAEEVRALRKEVAGLRTEPAGPGGTLAATDGHPAEPDQATAGEARAVEQSRVEELSQTKVEASERFPIRITGMALFNAYTNGRYNNESDNPTIASLTPGGDTGGGTLRQSIIGLLFDGPTTFAGGKVSGSLYLDLFGGSTSSLNHLVRLRTASINLAWTNTTVSVGQEKPIISPRDPNSFAQVGVSPLTGAGNLWLWQPQIRVEQRFSFNRDTGLKAQVGVFQTSLLNIANSGYASPVPGQPTEGSSPGGEGRLELWRKWGETGRLEIAGGLHVNHNHVGPFSLPSNVYSLDWFFRPFSKLEFSGMYFHGRNLAVLGGLQQGYAVLPGGHWLPVVGSGGWAQLRFPVTQRLAFDVYGGQQDDMSKDLLPGYIGRNQAYFANVAYRLAPNVIVSLEGGQVRTAYYNAGTRLNDHYDLGVAYLF